MHEIAQTAAGARAIIKLTAPCFVELGDRTQLRMYGRPREAAHLHRRCARCCAVFIAESGVHVTHQVVGQVFQHVKIVELAVLRQFRVHILVKILEVLTDSRLVHGLRIEPLLNGTRYRVRIKVRE